MAIRTAQINTGTVVSIRGSVIDVRFQDKLPEIHNQLTAGSIVIEVLIHLTPEVRDAVNSKKGEKEIKEKETNK